MAKFKHEIRDPIYGFVYLDTDERKVIDSSPFQRLRHIHQLGLSYLVYPSATHKRFEHSIGVLELASRVFDVVTNTDNLLPIVRDILLPVLNKTEELPYWKKILRMSALCHDLGHLPFSHAAEKDLLPNGYTHENLTEDIIHSPEMEKIWGNITPPLRADDISKIAVGPGKAKNKVFSNWESILSDIITSDAFGVDRMDYLLRDSYHMGVAYGHFDHYRLIDTLRILPAKQNYQEEAAEKKEPEKEQAKSKGEKIDPELGVEEGGLRTTEALQLARYFMFSQVYYHRHRRIYDIHIADFLKEHQPGGKFPTNIEELLKYTDNEINAAIAVAARTPEKAGHTHADRIMNRKHFKPIWDRNPQDIKINQEAGKAIFNKLKERYGEENVRYDNIPAKGGAPDFPVLTRDERIMSSLELSEVLLTLKPINIEFVYVEPNISKEAHSWLVANREEIIKLKREEE